MADVSTSIWANKFRGATVEDLDPPAALSTHPDAPIAQALIAAYEREYTHLTVVRPSDKSLVGYISIPRLKALLAAKTVRESDPVQDAMIRFRRKNQRYTTITMETPLEDLERFFGQTANGEDFAVVTDQGRRFVLGVATKADLEEFLKRRPA